MSILLRSVVCVAVSLAPFSANAAAPQCSDGFQSSGPLYAGYYVDPLFSDSLYPLAKDAAVATRGSFIVVWDRDGDVAGQTFTDEGAPGAQIDFGIPVQRSLDAVTVEAGSDERFVAASADNGKVYASVLPATSDSATSARADDGGSASVSKPVVATHRNGHFIVAWSHPTGGTLRRFDTDGGALGTTFDIATQPHDAAYRRNGNLDVIGTRFSGQTSEIVAERIAPGAESSSRSTVLQNSLPPNYALSTHRAGFVVGWTESRAIPDDSGVFDKLIAQRYRRDGTARGNTIGLSRDKTSTPTRVELSAFSDGGFVAAWQRGDEPAYGRGYPGNSDDAGSWTRVVGKHGRKPTRREQRSDENLYGAAPRPAAGQAGRFVVAWTNVSTEFIFADGCETDDDRCHEYYDFFQEVGTQSCRKR